ncbi:hypothetical protein [Dyadobacter sandarakinus]|uniref:Lipoprotein n=1 Tax=Dyadobacter sandarakinus TaxID=2747268 RepID=A0ABX7I156_9BACT|nr:hypothetical protein [Dyadobacter sandarakinus]QRQ99793.1 hypothetical protein HWI92_02085 [Dyadobacter sandarakinus]
MKKELSVFLFIALILSGCTSQPDITIHFSLNSDSVKRSLNVHFENHTESDLMILSLGSIIKVESKHPCGSIRLDNFTKISSHKDGDCSTNMGQKLFVFYEIVPFDKTDYLRLKNEMTNLPWFKDSKELFTYIDSSKKDESAFPAFILIKAGSSTLVKYTIQSSLSEIDHGSYQVFWADQKEIDKTLWPQNSNKYKLGDALLKIKSFKYNTGLIACEPFIFNL